MKISEVYTQEIAREILIEMLRDGIIPSGEAVSQALKHRAGSLDLSKPELSQSQERFDYLEEASASKMQRIVNRALGAIRVLYQAQLQGERSIVETADRALAELQSLQRRIKSLDNRVTELLLTTENTAGFFSAFRENFKGMDFVSPETTCTVDNEIGVAYAGELQNDQAVRSPLTMERISPDAISVQLSDNSATASPGTRDSVITDMLNDSSSPWIYTARKARPGSLGLVVTIDLSNARDGSSRFIRTRKISLIPYIVNNSVSVRVQYSRNGVIWEDLPVENPERSIADGTFYAMEELELLYLRIYMERGSYDRIAPNGTFEYDFGIRELAIADSSNIYQEESELVSENILFYKEDGELKTFSKAVLSDACGEALGNTSVDYFIAMLDSGLTRGPWQKVTPTSSAGSFRTAIAGNLIATDSRVEIDHTASAGFSNSRNVFMLDHVVTSEEGIEVWRNAGSNERLYKVRQPDGRVVEDGWRKGEGIYSTYFYVEDVSGREINFGPKKIRIDGRQITGTIKLPQGIHYAEVQEENWFSLEGLHDATTFDPTTKTFTGTQTKYGDTGFELSLSEAPNVEPLYSVIDPLYPYNHKLLIEGVRYNAAFNDNSARTVYQGFSRYAADILQQRGDENSISGAEFSIVETLNGAELEKKIAISWVQEGDENPREVFSVVEKSNQDPASGLVFKAVFKTLNPNITPTLEGYEIRVAE